MTKKHKTRQEKIILQLKRELAKKSQIPAQISTKFKPRQEAILKEIKIEVEQIPLKEKIDLSAFSFDPKLIRRDLFKTLGLSLIVVSFEFVLYLALR